MAPVIAELARRSDIESRVLSTGQHREMLDQALSVFEITPDYELSVMRPDQTPTEVFAKILAGLQPILSDWRPDWLLVQGDTTTVLAAALGGAYAGCHVGHVEAGLRTYDRQNPFPEELNRVLVDHASDLLFAPTARAQQALLREGIAESKIRLTGNTIVDALRHIVQKTVLRDEISVRSDKRLILVTAHRRENHGPPLDNILRALQRLAERSDVHIVYAVHRSPNVWQPTHKALEGCANVTLMEPLDYLSFVQVMRQAFLILTDSGGVQEEALSLGVPVLVMRSVTERPEVIEAGVGRLVGADTETIVREASALMDNPLAYESMAKAVNPYGDGHAALRIVDAICQWRESI